MVKETLETEKNPPDNTMIRLIGGPGEGLQEGGQDPNLHQGGRDTGLQMGGHNHGQLVRGQDPSLQEGGQDPGQPVGGRDPDHKVGGQDHLQHVGGQDHDQPVGGPGHGLQVWGTNQCVNIWGDQILTPVSGGTRSAAEVNAAEDNAPADVDDDPMDHIPSGQCDEPHDVDGDHTQPDEGEVPKTPEEGDVQHSLDAKMSKTTTTTFQTVLAVPAGKEPKTTVKSPPTAKTAKSKVEKKEAEHPEVSKPAKSRSEKPTDDLTYMKKTIGGLEEDKPNIEELTVVTTKLKKVQGEEFSKSTTQTRLVELETKSSPMIATEAPDNNVTAEAAPPIEVTSEASREPTALTPTAAEENPAEEQSEEAKEEAANEPMEAFTKPVVED